MFGYIRPKKSELLVREYEVYRGVYCGVCRELGDSYGLLSRLALSYDSTFYALLLLSLQSDGCPGFSRRHCVANPLKKCTFCTGAKLPLKQAAALCVLLTVYKLQDDRRDHGRSHRLRAALLLPLTRRAYRKAAADYPWMEMAIRSCMEQQPQAERALHPDLDSCAEPSAQMLAAVLSHEAEDGTPQARILRSVGYYLGRWVYLMDAADDLEQDAKNGDFNFFVRQYDITRDSSVEQLTETRIQANRSLNLTISELCASFALLQLHNFAPILQNIVEQGLPEMQKQLLFMKTKEKK